MEKAVVGLITSLAYIAISSCAKEGLYLDSEINTDSDIGADSATSVDTDVGADSNTGADSDGEDGTDTCADYDWDANVTSEDWRREIIGCYARFYEIKIGDARNDGIKRLYSACYNGNLMEWSFISDDTPWEMRRCGGATDNVDDAYKRMISIWIGPGRNDGVNRIYAANANGDTYEFSYNESSDGWEMMRISGGNLQTGIVVGDSRNDGVTRVISTGLSINVNEFSWDGGAWSTTAVSDGPHSIWPPSLGQARNDGRNRLYCPDWSQPYLREYSWNNTSFEEVAIETSKQLVKTVTGDGRNDGIERVYASEMKGHIIEFSSDNTGDWDQIDIMEDQGENLSRYGLYLARTHGDDTNRLYSVAQAGRLTEYAFENNTWTNTVIDAVSGATADLTVGKGRNDNINRVYVAGSNGVLFEYTHSDFTGSD
jgi:hypothetical protein